MLKSGCQGDGLKDPALVSRLSSLISHLASLISHLFFPLAFPKKAVYNMACI